jgi:hypothetical protein
MGAQRLVHVVHDLNVFGVVEAGALGDQAGFSKDRFQRFRALFGEVGGALLLVDSRNRLH